MQHVLRCWERQSDGSKYKKNLRRPRLRPDPAEGAYSVPADPLGGVGLAVPSPRTPSPLSAFGPRLSYPTPKLVPTPLPPGGLPKKLCCNILLQAGCPSVLKQ